MFLLICCFKEKNQSRKEAREMKVSEIDFKCESGHSFADVIPGSPSAASELLWNEIAHELLPLHIHLIVSIPEREEEKFRRQ